MAGKVCPEAKRIAKVFSLVDAFEQYGREAVFGGIHEDDPYATEKKYCAGYEHLEILRDEVGLRVDPMPDSPAVLTEITSERLELMEAYVSMAYQVLIEEVFDKACCSSCSRA